MIQGISNWMTEDKKLRFIDRAFLQQILYAIEVVVFLLRRRQP